MWTTKTNYSALQYISIYRHGVRGSAISVAAIKGDLNIIKILASITKNPNNIPSCTPMHLAAYEGHIDILKFLVSFIGDLNSLPFGILHMAAMNGHTDVLKLLAPLIRHPNEGNF